MITTPITMFKTCYNCMHAIEIFSQERCYQSIGDMLIRCDENPLRAVHIDSQIECEKYKNLYKHISQPGKEQ